MRPLLVFLEPRDIPETQEAVLSLGIPVLRMMYMYQIEVARRLPPLLPDWADPILVISDDAVATQDSFDRVMRMIEDGAPAATGWCQLGADDPRANLSTEPIKGPLPTADGYTFPPVEWVRAQTGVQRTYFAGHAMTAVRRALWDEVGGMGVHPSWVDWPRERYFPKPEGWPRPFDIGCASDHHMSWRLQQRGVPIVYDPQAEVVHLKERWLMADRAPRLALKVCVETPRVIKEGFR